MSVKFCRIFPMVIFFCSLAAAQHEHHGMSMKHSADARLEVQDDAAAHTLLVKVGPLELPARADHMQVTQAPASFLTIPFDGWITGYHPRLVDAAERAVPGRLLHHVAFYNTGRADFLCPNKLEHIFGAGGEMNQWPPIPGYGYRVHPGDRIRVDTMFHNPTPTTYPKTYLEVAVDYRPAGTGEALTSVYPAWFDVQECGNSGYDLPPGRSQNTGQITLGFSGVLLGVGGHMHDYGRELEFVNSTRQETIAKLDSRLDDSGKILAMPVEYFTDRGGYKLEKGDVVKITATYDNPTLQKLQDGAMGIVVGYFVPAIDKEMAGLKK